MGSNETKDLLEEVVNSGLEKLSTLDPTSTEYAQLAATVVKLHEQQMAEVKVDVETDEKALARGAESEKQDHEQRLKKEETKQTWLKLGCEIGKTLLLIGANCLWMRSIMHFEETGTISTKAFGFIGKPKIFG